MRSLNFFNWKDLVDIETPPCLTLTVNLQRNNSTAWGERLRNQISTAESLMQECYGERVVKSFDLESRIQSFLSTKKAPLAKSLGLFLSPEISAYAGFHKEFPELCVVADTFHIKPFIVNNWQRPVIAMYEGDDGLQAYVWSEFEISPLGRIDSLEHFFKTHRLNDQSVVILGTRSYSTRSRDQLAMLRLQNDFRFVDVGVQDLYCFIEQIPGIAKAQHKLEEMQFLQNARVSLGEQSTPIKILDDLNRTYKTGTFASPVKTPLWGKFHDRNHLVDMYEEQRNAKDDCIVDDIYELAIKKNMKTLFIEPQEWSLQSPFVFNPNREEEVA